MCTSKPNLGGLREDTSKLNDVLRALIDAAPPAKFTIRVSRTFQYVCSSSDLVAVLSDGIEVEVH
jgi:hypothetical protein